MHVHFGPEPVIDRVTGSTHVVDPIQAATEARDHGLTAIVLKAHEFPSTMAAYLAQKVVPGVRVFGGITCDHPVGGVNPIAVETALRSGAKVVWLPTISSTASTKSHEFFGSDGLPVIDEYGTLLPHVQDILDLVCQYGAVLASGHITAEEHYAVVSAMRGRGHVLVTHAMQGNGAGPEFDKQQCVELAEMGAHLEFCAHTCSGSPAKAEAVAGAIRDLPPDQVVLSSDYGWNTALPRPVEGLQSHVNSLWEFGVEERHLRRMVAVNPSRLLGLG